MHDNVPRYLTVLRMNLEGLTYIDEREAAILDEMANLLAKHKLVPFFGAGISRPQLGVAASGLAEQLANQLEIPADTLLSELSDQYAERFGEEAFEAFLKERLVLSDFDDAKVSTHRLLLSLSRALLYTTNQDNIFELVAKRYGRACRRVVTLEDLSDATPGEPLLIKFHGDLDVPSSLVFGKRSYETRIASQEHFLDIKLRADLLGKRLLFLGYSLQDENVDKLLHSVRKAFAGTMPQSYLVAYDYHPSMEELTRNYGIHVVNPRQLCPNAQTNNEAFELCLKALCDLTIKLQAQRGLDMLFRDEPINPRVAIEYEVATVAEMAKTEQFDDAIAAFRGVLDQTTVPISLRQTVTDTFLCLCARVDPKNETQMGALRAALFNVRLPPQFSAHAMAALMAACNRRPAPSSVFDDFGVLLCPALPDGTRPIAAALAIAMLRERGEPITEHFRSLAHSWLAGYQELEPKVLDLVKSCIEFAWPNPSVFESPLTRHPLPFRAKGYHEIRDELMARLPQKFRLPQE